MGLYIRDSLMTCLAACSNGYQFFLIIQKLSPDNKHSHMKKPTLFVAIILSSIFSIAQPNAKSIKPSVKCGVATANYVTKAIDTSATRGVADNYYLWDNNAVIVVKFMPGGSDRLRSLVTQYAKEWEQFANIKFNFVPDNTANTHIRIKLGRGLGHNSYIGTQCNLLSQSEQTLNLDTTDFTD